MSMKQYVVLAVLFLVAAVLAGGYAGLLAGGVVGPHLRYERLTLVDAEDNERAVLGATADEEAYGLALLDEGGRKRVFLSLDETGAPRLTLLDGAELARAELFADSGQSTGLRLRNETGIERVSLGVDGDGNGQSESAVRIYDAEGAPLLRMGADGNERAAFSVLDGEGRGVFGATVEGLPALRFFDAAERPRLTMGVDAEHRGVLRLLDEDNIPRAELAENSGDGVGLTLRNRADTPAASLSAGEETGGTLHIYGENGNVLASLGMNGAPLLRFHETPAGHPVIQLVSPAFEFPLAELLIDDEQHAGMEFRDHDGEVVWSAP